MDPVSCFRTAETASALDLSFYQDDNGKVTTSMTSNNSSSNNMRQLEQVDTPGPKGLIV